MTLNMRFNISRLYFLPCKMRITMTSISVFLWELKKMMHEKHVATVSLSSLLWSAHLWSFNIPILLLRQLSRQVTCLRPYSYWMEFKLKFGGNLPERKLLYREDRILTGLQRTFMLRFLLILKLCGPNCLDYKSNTCSVCKSRICRKVKIRK